MASIWLIISASDTATLESRITLLRTAYASKKVRVRDNPNMTEQIGTMQYNSTNTKAFIGTSRASLGDIDDLASGRSWFTFTQDSDFMRDAEWQLPAIW
jgi:hypothetical protein